MTSVMSLESRAEEVRICPRNGNCYDSLIVELKVSRSPLQDVMYYYGHDIT